MPRSVEGLGEDIDRRQADHPEVALSELPRKARAVNEQHVVLVQQIEYERLVVGSYARVRDSHEQVERSTGGLAFQSVYGLDPPQAVSHPVSDSGAMASSQPVSSARPARKPYCAGVEAQSRLRSSRSTPSLTNPSLSWGSCQAM